MTFSESIKMKTNTYFLHKFTNKTNNKMEILNGQNIKKNRFKEHYLR